MLSEEDLNRFLEVVPEEMRQLPQWVRWRLVVRDGKQTKVPFDAKTGHPASSTDRNTWSSFDVALEAWQNDDEFEGIGFVFSEDDDYCGIDLDDCIDPATGDLKPWALRIVLALNSFTEISPSGTGVKIFIKASKPGTRCRTAIEDGVIEIYDCKRYFTVTGRRLNAVSPNVESRITELGCLYAEVFEVHDATTPSPEPSPTPQIGDDQALLDRMFASKNGEDIRSLWEGDTTAHGGDDSAADLALCNHLAFWTGRDRSRMDRLFRRSGLYRAKWERDDYRERTLDKAIAACSNVYGGQGAGGSHKPTIRIDVDEHRVVDEAVAALAADPELFRRGNMLVRVLRDHQTDDGVGRWEGSATIGQVPAANIRERLTRSAMFTRLSPRGDVVACHPPQWLVAAVEARGEWNVIRHLKGVSGVPVLRSDGSVFQTPGYDLVTGVLYEPLSATNVPMISNDLAREDAVRARNELLEVVADFRFESEAHKAAWLAGLLTVLARFAFQGPAPLFLIDANVRGAGKGLLAQIIGLIVLGRMMSVVSYSHDSEEMRKKITAMAIAGDTLVLLDNLEGKFGNDAIDRALTTTRWKDRILGKSEQIDLLLLLSWFANGNNVQVAADTTRRIIYIRLDVLEERPEERTDFRHPDLIAWVGQERGRLLAAALTILSAYIKCGRPQQTLTPFGSFEGWSGLVRQCVVWLGLPDPCITRAQLMESSDSTVDAIAQFMDAFGQYDPHDTGVYVSEMLAKLYSDDGWSQPQDAVSRAMRATLENIVGCPPGKAPSNRQVGNCLKTYRRRVVNGRMFDCDSQRGSKGKKWRLVRTAAATTPTGGGGDDPDDSGDSGDSCSSSLRAAVEEIVDMVQISVT